MNVSYFKQVILIAVLTTLPLHSATAESLWDTALRITGISATANQVRGSSSIKGNLWLSKIDGASANEAQQMTSDGTYHSPLWIPGSNTIVAVKENQLIQLAMDTNEEKVLHVLSDHTTLIGFDKGDANLMLILQDAIPAILSLSSGQITFLPYDKDNLEDRAALDLLMNSERDYGEVKVSIAQQRIRDASGHFRKMNKIYIKGGKQNSEIACLGNCGQPALTENGRLLVFVGR